MGYLTEYNRLSTQFANRANFFVVYIREAHPQEGWTFEGNTSVIEAKEIQDRRDAIEIMIKEWKYLCPDLRLNLNEIDITDGTNKRDGAISVVIDNMDNQLDRAFDAWEERLYVLDNKKVVYKGGQGPIDYNMDGLTAFLASYIN